MRRLVAWEQTLAWCAFFLHLAQTRCLAGLWAKGTTYFWKRSIYFSKRENRTQHIFPITLHVAPTGGGCNDVMRYSSLFLCFWTRAWDLLNAVWSSRTISSRYHPLESSSFFFQRYLTESDNLLEICWHAFCARSRIASNLAQLHWLVVAFVDGLVQGFPLTNNFSPRASWAVTQRFEGQKWTPGSNLKNVKHGCCLITEVYSLKIMVKLLLWC